MPKATHRVTLAIIAASLLLAGCETSTQRQQRLAREEQQRLDNQRYAEYVARKNAELDAQMAESRKRDEEWRARLNSPEADAEWKRKYDLKQKDWNRWIEFYRNSGYTEWEAREKASQMMRDR